MRRVYTINAAQREWPEATHQITIEHGAPFFERETIEVKLEPDTGMIYTRAEWERHDPASWACDADGEWTRHGRAPVCASCVVRRFEVAPVAPSHVFVVTRETDDVRLDLRHAVDVQCVGAALSFEGALGVAARHARQNGGFVLEVWGKVGEVWDTTVFAPGGRTISYEIERFEVAS